MDFILANPWNLPEIGTRVYYVGNHFDPGCRGLVVSHSDPMNQVPGGARVVLDDDRDHPDLMIHHFTGERPRYRILAEDRANEEEISQRLVVAERAALSAKLAREASAALYQSQLEAGRTIAATLISATAKALIVAEYVEDDSDCQTDYFAHRTTKRVVLAESAHTRDLFAEMRKAALRYEPTRHLATAGVEQRQKYSMGSGYFLSEGESSHATGWHIRKCRRYGDGWPNDILVSLAQVHALGHQPGNP